jgi:hypothetical protein
MAPAMTGLPVMAAAMPSMSPGLGSGLPIIDSQSVKSAEKGGPTSIRTGSMQAN